MLRVCTPKIPPYNISLAKTVNFKDVQSLYGSQCSFVVKIWFGRSIIIPLILGVQNSRSNKAKLFDLT